MLTPPESSDLLEGIFYDFINGSHPANVFWLCPTSVQRQKYRIKSLQCVGLGSVGLCGSVSDTPYFMHISHDLL